MVPEQNTGDSTVNQASSTDVDTGLWMYVTLGFPLEAAGTASRFEVFYRFAGPLKGTDPAVLENNTVAQGRTAWTWLGTAYAHQFRVTQLLVPFSIDAVVFAVQPADVLDKLVSFDNATITTLSRP